MRRALLLTLWALPAWGAPTAEVRLRADALRLTTGPDGAPGATLIGYGLRARFDELARWGGVRLEGAFDGRAREDLRPSTDTRHDLGELRLSLRDLGPLDLSVGRLSLPLATGFLLLDGAELALRCREALSLSLAGGLRADFDDLSPDRDRPTAATGLRLRLERLEMEATAAWTRDRLAPAGRADDGERQRDVVDAGGRALAYPTDGLWVLLSGEVADVAAWAVPRDDPRTWTLTESGYALTQIYAQVGYRPWRPVRLDTSYLYSASRFEAPGSTDRYQDAAARLRWQATRDLRVQLRGRLRFRDQLVLSGDAYATRPADAVRTQAGVEWSNIADLGLLASLGAVLDRGDRHDEVEATAEAGVEGPWAYAILGARSVVRDADDRFGTFTPGDDEARPALDPYSRAVRSALSLRAGAHARWGHLGGSADYDLAAHQAQLFVQGGLRWR